MGQKVRPTGFRVGIMEDWRSRWYASKHEFSDFLVEDFKIRRFIKGKYSYAGIPKIEIERTRDAVTVFLFTARPGIIIGRKGAEVARLTEGLQGLTGARVQPDDARDDRGGPRRRQPVGQGGRQALHPDLPPQEHHLDPRRDPDG